MKGRRKRQSPKVKPCRLFPRSCLSWVTFSTETRMRNIRKNHKSFSSHGSAAGSVSVTKDQSASMCFPFPNQFNYKLMGTAFCFSFHSGAETFLKPDIYFIVGKLSQKRTIAKLSLQNHKQQKGHPSIKTSAWVRKAESRALCCNAAALAHDDAVLASQNTEKLHGN